MRRPPPILFILTSNTRLGEHGGETGFHFEELATPYYVFFDAGYESDIASIKGGEAIADPASLHDEADNPEPVNRFLRDHEAMEKLADTIRLEEIDFDRYEAIFIPGGHATMWDMPDNPQLSRLISRAYADGKIIGTVCHGAAALIGATKPDGRPLVEGMTINSFTDDEERAIGKDDIMPFLLESRLRALGADFIKGSNFQSFSARDGNLLTGQNPASCERLARKMIEAMRQQTQAITPSEPTSPEQPARL